MEIHICSITEYDAETRMPTIENPNSSTFYLVPTEDGTSPDLFTEWVYVNGAWEMFGSAKIDLSGYLTDVQINGQSIVSDGVANVPLATSSVYGAVKFNPSYGITVSTGTPYINNASESDLKSGTNDKKPITSNREHIATFYGLAKASGDTTQSASSNAVGVYTEDAKVAIQKMLGIYQAPWELIREDTFTNETEADHIITTDANGEAFELTDIIMLFETDGAAKAGTYGQIRFIDEAHNRRFVSEGNAWNVSLGNMGVWHMITQENGLFDGSTTSVSNGTQPGFIRKRHVAKSPSINGFELVGNSPFIFSRIEIPTITGKGHYKLYGRRKWQ